MKLFDRYVIGTFLKNYFISFAVLVGLYIVLDMIFNFDNLVDTRTIGPGGLEGAWEVFHNIFDYYSYQTFLIFIHLSGIIPVVAAAFTLIRLGRFNELTAMLAAGVPLLRLAMPIILTGVALNVLLVVDQELVIPNMIPKLIRSHDEVRQPTVPSFPIQGLQDSRGSILIAGRYDPPTDSAPAMMSKLDVIERDARLQPTGHLWADSAVWNARRGEWDLINGRRVTGLLPDEHLSATQSVAVYKSNVTPDEISLYRSGDFVQLLSTSRINQLLDPKQNYGKLELLRVKHTRFTQPLCNIFLLLLAIPCVLNREPGRLKMGAVKCVMWSGLCLGTMFITYQLAGNPPPSPAWAERWPALMAWMPVFLFGPVAIWLLDRIKT